MNPAAVTPDAARPAMIILAVDDLPGMTAFYREAFGWPQTIDVPVLASFRMPGGMELALYLRSAFAHNTGQAPEAPAEGALASTEIYLHVGDPAAAIARLQAAGARLLSALAPRSWGDEAAYFADPAGNVLAIGRPLPQDAAASD